MNPGGRRRRMNRGGPGPAAEIVRPDRAGPTLPKMTTDRKPMVRAGPVAPVQTRRTSRAACWRISKAL